MKIKCDDTRRARSNLEAAVKLGRQRAGLFGYIETINNNGELYVHYRSGTGIHGLTDRRKIVFEENYIVLKNDRPIIYSLIECVILFVVIAALFLVIGEFIYGILFAHKVIFDVKAALLSVWLIGVIKVGPMHYVKKYLGEKSPGLYFFGNMLWSGYAKGLYNVANNLTIIYENGIII